MKLKDSESRSGGISRRAVLGGLVAASFLPVISRARTPGKDDQDHFAFATEAAGLARTLHTATPMLDGRILVAGGQVGFSDGDVLPVSSVEIYDPRSNLWQAASPMISARSRHAAIALPSGLVMVLGGFLDGPIPSVEIYDPRRDSWQAGPSLAMARCDHSASFVNGSIVVLGGLGSFGTPSAEICELANSQFQMTP